MTGRSKSDALGAAGPTRAFTATAVGLGFWVTLGVAVTNWYDRKRLHRMPRRGCGGSSSPRTLIQHAGPFVAR
jgi:hypothetical protein